MRKKQTITFIFLLLLLIFSGCGKKNVQTELQPVDEQKKEETVTEETMEITENPKEEKKEIPKNIIEEQYSKEGSYFVKYGEEDEGYDFEFSYHVPMITDDSEDANYINNEIADFAGDAIDTVEKMTSDSEEEKYEAAYFSISYEYFENNNIVSLILEGDAIYSDWKEYAVYNYNKKTHKRVTNEEMLVLAELGEEEFEDEARSAMGEIAINNMYEYVNYLESEDNEASEEDKTMQQSMIADYIQYYMYTIADKNINKDMKMYFDGDGALWVCGLVYVPAGAGQYYTKAKLSDVMQEDPLDRCKEYVEKYHFDGFEKKCLGLYDLEGYSGTAIHNLEDGGHYEDQVYIGFLETDPSVFLFQVNGDGYDLNYSGSLKWIDCNENGMAFEYELTKLDMKKLPKDEIRRGSFYLQPYGNYDENTEEYVSGAYYQFIEGEDVLDTTEGEKVTLTKSFG